MTARRGTNPSWLHEGLLPYWRALRITQTTTRLCPWGGRTKIIDGDTHPISDGSDSLSRLYADAGLFVPGIGYPSILKSR